MMWRLQLAYHLVQIAWVDVLNQNPLRMEINKKKIPIGIVELTIITLFKGERKVDRPIHKAEFFKELKIRELEKAVNLFANDLEKYAR